MRTLVMSFCRRENAYLREWVQYYKDLGFTNICLLDNTYDGEEKIEDSIKDYIDDGFVFLENFHNISNCQVPGYNEMFKKYKSEYDWIACFDCDEFLTFTTHKSIDEYLSMPCFSDRDAIKINWMVYDDNDMLESDGRPVLERLTRPMDYDKGLTYNFSENNHIKCIISTRCTADPLFTTYNPKISNSGANMHCPHTTNLCDNNGNPSEFCSPFLDYNFDTAYLRHFPYKTVTEFANRKLKIGTPDIKINGFIQNIYLNNFFKLNKMTDDKIDIIKRAFGAR